MQDLKKILILLNILYSIYLDYNDEIILHNRNLIVKEPKISVIIPIYNGGKYLKYSLESVQNQKFKDIEIIIVDDNSSDDSLKIIHSYIKKDKRIKLIKNKTNRRILFSKSFGALNSKGKYIIEVDQDDMIRGDDFFGISYNESENSKLDIFHFEPFISNNITNLPKLDIYAENKSIEVQPKIKFDQFKNNIYLLWGNLIKSDLYKKVIYNLWPIVINYKIIFQEDFLITFFILIYAQKSKVTKNKFYYKFQSKKRISYHHKKNPEFYLCVIFAGIIFYEYYIYSYPQDFQIISNYINVFENSFKRAKKLFPSLFNYFFGKILSNNRLLNINKTKLMKIFNISHNCDSYKYLNKKKRSILFDNFSDNKAYFQGQQKDICELSIIIRYSNYKSIIKIINNINSQIFYYFEIIIIYDEENIGEYNLLKNYIKDFHFIKLFHNEKKRGTFYSISKGVLQAEGNFLIILNPNSFFLSRQTFQNIFNEIKKDDVDILEFNLYKILPNNYINLYKCKHFKSRFNLNKIKFNLDYSNIDIKNELLTNKIIKTRFFKNIIKNYKIDKFKEKIDYYYNDIFAYIFENNFHKFKRITSESIYMNDIDFDNPKLNNFTLEETKKIEETIFYINFIFDNSKNENISKEKVLKEFFNVLSIIFNKFSKISKNSMKLLNKFIRNHYISKSNKILLKFYYNSLIN